MTAADINTALVAGKDLLVTPGVYHLDQTINITRADTVVLGMGLATFINDNGVARNIDEAFRYYQKAADRGHQEASRIVGKAAR